MKQFTTPSPRHASAPLRPRLPPQHHSVSIDTPPSRCVEGVVALETASHLPQRRAPTPATGHQTGTQLEAPPTLAYSLLFVISSCAQHVPRYTMFTFEESMLCSVKVLIYLVAMRTNFDSSYISIVLTFLINESTFYTRKTWRRLSGRKRMVF